MKALLEKEVRLLLPAYIPALMLAFASQWLGSFAPDGGQELMLFVFWLGLVMLALSVFGREFSLRTFSLLLAQPFKRQYLWWTKLSVLAVALGTVVWAWDYAGTIWPGLLREISRSQVIQTAGTILSTTVSGALWTTLLLRQIAAAFWLTILIPMAILIVLANFQVSGATFVTVFNLYALAGFGLAWWLFSQAQEVAWTGGDIDLTGRSGAAVERSSSRKYRPWAALLKKEWSLVQIALLGMVLLFLLHLAIVWLRASHYLPRASTLFSVLEIFGGIWLVVPLVFGSLSVAEEGRLGTLDSQWSLPASRRNQFAIKLLAAMSMGGGLSAVLLWTAEGWGASLGTGINWLFFKEAFSVWALLVLGVCFVALALIGFYASTLAHSIVHALALAIGTSIVLWFVYLFVSLPPRISSFWFWEGDWINLVIWPLLAMAMAVLAYRNFKSSSDHSRFWAHNLLGLSGTLLLAISLAAALYHRAWEWFSPLEPAHGPAQLTQLNTAMVSIPQSSASTVLLPDGKLRVDYFEYQPGRPLFQFFKAQISLGGHPVSTVKNHVLNGSNWVAVTAQHAEIVAIRNNGTLWVSEFPRPRVWPMKRPTVQDLPELVQFGIDTNWKSAVSDRGSVVLLKQDGTLWRWGAEPHNIKQEPQSLRSLEPYRLGTASNWVSIFADSYSRVFLWDQDDQAWQIHTRGNLSDFPEAFEVAPGEIIARSTSLDHLNSKALAIAFPVSAVVREDGTLWFWDPQQSGRNSPPNLVQCGSDRDWAEIMVSLNYERSFLVGRKKDGSLWRWTLDTRLGPDWFTQLTEAKPARLGTHSDWIALGYLWDNVLSLAADGSLWLWDHNDKVNFGDLGLAFVPTRKPLKIGNVLEGQ
jgi:hypothetical protein